ncbi:hypothetical protein HYPSUDRAFT_1017943 [Hypholoma sublateritium FD-334 SS-4]|uniref:NmrA-like domain-containing protein n=1 Tax=Hypholoma sublateritium (strain FD-334 SS-4) TaxID=945553 RepID=A0A0D2NLD8_HYPSF|nr:hypothetical protein HYPSUDRAFT_1017943 [Hypholoma sublateritium FD-334 SS-4]
MASKINIFLTGATGHIGGSVLARLLNHPNFSSFELNVLVRSTDKAKKLRTLRVKVTLGSYDEKLEILAEAASHADIVISMADADNLPASTAILDGMKIKHAASGKAPILIHTSGTGIIVDDARGLHGDHREFSDLESEVLNAIPVTALHRNVDIPIIEADKAGYINAYIITPGTVFGYPSGPLVDLGIQNIPSIQMRYLIKPCIARKQGAYFGKGLNLWSAVDVDDTADLYLILFDAILRDPESAGHGTEGYYFVENFQYSALEVAQAISEGLVEQGIMTTPEISPFTLEEGEKYFGTFWPLLGANSKVKADRSRALGWAPKRDKEDLIANLKSGVAFYLKGY